MSVSRLNLASLLEDLANEPGRPAFVLHTSYRSFRWTAGDVRTAALDLAARLAARGVRPGDRVLLQGSNSPEWCAAFLGIVALGAVSVPLDADSSPGFSLAVAEQVSSRAGCFSSDLAGALHGRLPTIEILEKLIPSRGPGPSFIPYRASPEETAEIVFTSGTTAQPRGVELTHANLLSALERIERGFQKREWFLRPLLPFRFLCLVPLSHLFGQTLGLFLPVLLRSTGLFLPTLQPARIIRAIRTEKPLAVISVPRTLSSLREFVTRDLERKGRRVRFDRGLERAAGLHALRRIWLTRDLRSVLGWRTWAMVVGGAPLSPELERFWWRSGFAVIQGYGLTEAAPIIAVHNPLDGKLHSLGRPVGGVEVRLSEDGELLVRGPNVMKGYFGDPEATREAIRDGWLHTGDLAEQDREGRLYLKGRRKDVIVTPGGMNVFPSDVEHALQSVEGVQEAVVFGLPGPEGDQVHAAVLTGSPPPDPDGLRAAANERLLSHQRIARVVLWEGPDFPRTPTGKVRRGEVAGAVKLAGHHRSAGSTSPVAEVSRVAKILEQVRSDLVSGLDPGIRLAEKLDLESLEMVELLSLLEEEHGIRVDDREVRPSLSVGELERLVTGESRRALDLEMPRWSRRAPVRWLRSLLGLVLVRPFFRLFVGLTVEGREHVESLDPPCLLVANHTSALDVPAVCAALPPKLRRRLSPAMAIETLPEHFEPGEKSIFKRLRSALLYNLAVLVFNAYPLPQTRAFRPSLEYAGELMDAGFCPLIFPEGRMSRTGKMLPFKSGIGLLAARTRARILPVYIVGLAGILPPGGRWPGRGRARLVFGEIFDPLEGAAGDTTAATERIEAAVGGLDPGEPDP